MLFYIPIGIFAKMSRSIQTKNKIIHSAISLFNTQGYRATSLSDITKSSGLTKGAIYGNFANKDAVAVAAFEFAVDKVILELRERIKNSPTAPLKLKAIASYYREYVLNPPIEGGCPIVNTAIEADDNHPLLRSRVIRIMHIMKDSIKKIIYRGIREKQIEPTVKVDEFASMYYSSIKGSIILSRVEGDLESYRLTENFLNDFIDKISI